MLEDYIDEFMNYLKSEKNVSPYTIDNYKSDIKILCTFLRRTLGKTNIEEITMPILRKYVVYLKVEKKYANETMRRKIFSCRSFLKYLYMMEYIPRNIAETIKAPKAEDTLPIYFTVEDLKKFLTCPMIVGDETALMDKVLFETFAFTGARRFEILNLNWKDIDFSKRTINIQCSKGKKQRLIPFAEPLLTDLWAYLQSRLPVIPNDPVFISLKDNRLSNTGAETRFRKYIKKCGLEGKGYTIHKLRHTYASLLLQNGADLISIQQLLGHSDLNSTKIYTHTDMKHLRKEAAKFPLVLK